MLSRSIKVIAGTVGFVAAIIAIAEAWESIRSHTRNLAEWLYPLGVIVVLVAVLLVVAALFLRSRRSPWSYDNDDARDHDRRVVRDVRTALARAQINQFRDIDFGGRWRGERIYPMQTLANLDHVEHQPVAPELREAVRALFLTASEFGAYYPVDAGKSILDYAAVSYSRMSPPRRSRRCTVAGSPGRRGGRGCALGSAGGRWSSGRCGRWWL
jgi:hypothetical protein